MVLLPIQTCSMSDVFGCFMLGEELYVESEYSETVQNLFLTSAVDTSLIARETDGCDNSNVSAITP
jgi:hypothetical protein